MSARLMVPNERAAGRIVQIQRESVDTSGHRLLGLAMIGVLAGGIAIEVALGVRVWAQITGDASPHGLAGVLYGASDTLVSPFRSYETTSAVHTTSILEISPFVGMVAYLAATLVALAVLSLARYAVSHIEARRPQTVWLPSRAGAPLADANAFAGMPARPASIPSLRLPERPRHDVEPRVTEEMPTSAAV